MDDIAIYFQQKLTWDTGNEQGNDVETICGTARTKSEMSASARTVSLA